MKRILKCQKCHQYTMQETHSCGGTAITPKPAKFNLEDKYGRLRRKAKEDEWKKAGLI
ncbi:MAG: ribosome biogenesis protein [Nanoarchaeota archaeon]|nr:ribosome biogenesis protein [Nanoarchaeota archaeon]